MGLFSKKTCDVCGGSIGLMGNRKLADGNLCKDCAAKLSPWFSERKQSTVASIKEQLAYREENREKVERFETTLSYGNNTKVLIDEDQSLFMVTSARDLKAANPDVLSYAQVTGCDLDVKEHTDEVKREQRDRDGHIERVSYSPRRYKYSYDFYITIRVNHPYFDEMRFKLNDREVRIDYNDGSRVDAGPMGPGPRPNSTVHRVAGAVGAAAANNVRAQPRPGAGQQRPPMGGMGMMGGMGRTVTAEGSTSAPPMDVRLANSDYAHYVAMAEEIKDAVMVVRQQHRDEVAAASAPVMAVTCPWCGATTAPDASGCCEYCGGSLAG